MRSSRIVLPLAGIMAGLSTGLVAQTTNPINDFYRWDRSTEFTSRGALGSSAGYISQAFSHGHSAGLTRLTQTSFIIQDQNPSTREFFDVGTTGLDSAGRPDYARTRYYARNLALPASTSVTPTSALITVTTLAATPHIVIPRMTQWHHVWFLKSGAAWTSDGVSLHMSQADPYINSLLCVGNAHREIPRTEGTTRITQELGWSTVANSTTPRALARAWRLRTGWGQVVLNGGALTKGYGGYYGARGTVGCNTNDPNVGYAALDPDFDDSGSGNPSRHDDYAWLLNAGTRNAGRVAALFLSRTVLANGGVPTPFGILHVDLTDPLAAAVGAIPLPINLAGSSSWSVNLGAPNSSVRAFAAGLESWSAQAVVFTSTGPELSNLFSFRPKLTPAGYQRASVTSSTPQTLSPSSSDTSLLVRNDGRGEILVTQTRGSTSFGTARIAERTAVRIALNPAATQVSITTPSSQAVQFLWAWNK